MLRFVALLLVSLFMSAPALAFHCGTRLVHEGDTAGQVRAKCGEPSEINVRNILRRPMIWIRSRPVFASTDFIEVPVETWVYNFGPNKLMRRLRFEDGELVEIETLGYGYLP